MKEKLQVLGLAAGIYGGVYALGEAVHNYDCPREDIHTIIADDHMSEQWHKEQADRLAQHDQDMIDMQESRAKFAESAAENQKILDDIHATTHEITYKIGQIHGMLIVMEKHGYFDKK